jgi:serine/threonine-protein kinase HipA
MSCGDQGRYANAENILSQAGRFLLEKETADTTIRAMEDTVHERWYAVARSAGVSERDCEQISGAFAYPGFRQERREE